jgi:hypothetical protein
MNTLTFITILLLVCLFIIVYFAISIMEKEDTRQEELQKLKDEEDLTL